MITVDKMETVCELNYITLKKLHYKQKGVNKIWEIAELFDSVSILIYHTERNTFILVKQFRPPVFIKNGDGYTYELCAGICDKEVPLAQIAQEEVLEETGYHVDIDKIERVNSFYTSVGNAGSKQTMFYCEVDESQKVTQGGGVGLEDIEIVELPVDEVFDFMFNEEKVKTPGIMFAFMFWKLRYGK